jgi:hypothetical protein
MVRSLVFGAVIGIASISVSASAWEMPPIPSLKQQYEDAKIMEVTAIFENDPYFAGKVVNVEMFGRKISVDRTREPNTTPPGTPPPAAGGALASLTDVLNGLEAGAKGEVQINVERKWTDNGVLIHEKWGIVVGGQYNVKKEKTAPDKDGKTIQPE